jgi:AraC-like DNA-binding protein
MHELRCQPASPDLQPFVRAYAQREIFDLPGPVSAPIPARLEQTLEFQVGDHFEVFHATRSDRTRPVTLVGSQTEGGWTIMLTNKIISFGIFFQPVGFSGLFGIPPVELSNRAFDAVDILPSGIRQLHDQLGACVSFSSRVAVVEQFLRALVARSSANNHDLGCHAAGAIFRAHGAVNMREMAAHYELSVRQFERRFLRSTGVAPKTYARVARFQTALDTKLRAPHRSWLSIAHDLGYHDQMHMVHDFHELAGAAPNETLAKIRDARPPAMQEFSRL